MSHRTFHEVGFALSRSWGRDDGGNFEALVKSLSPNEANKCLLAAAVSVLLDIRQGQQDARAKARSAPATAEHPTSDGMLLAIRVSSGDTLIHDHKNFHSLSVRARGTIRRGGWKFVSEINRDGLMDVMNCGTATAAEILCAFGIEDAAA